MNDSYPVAHLSYSSVRTFMTNPYKFLRTYIYNDRDDKKSVAMVAGDAYHRAMQHYVKSKDFDSSYRIGQTFLDTVDINKIDFGKTGSMDEILRRFNAGMQNAASEIGQILTDDYVVIDVEKEGYASKNWITGENLTLPFKGYIDLVCRRKSDNRIVLFDHKLTATAPTSENRNQAQDIQTAFYFHICREVYGEEPAEMVFIHNKTGKNKDGSAQLYPERIDYAQAKTGLIPTIMNLIERMLIDISNPEKEYFPVPGDNLNADLWDKYIKGEILDTRAPQLQARTIAHKQVREVDYQETVEHTEAHKRIESKLLEFGVPLKLHSQHQGSAYTQYRFTSSRGVAVTDIPKRAGDIAMALGSGQVRILAPIYGTPFIGVEVPREDRTYSKKPEIKKGSGDMLVGEKIDGSPLIINIQKAPHLLIAGTTGSGKTTMVKSIIQDLAAHPITIIDMKGGFDFEDIVGNVVTITDESDAIKHLQAVYHKVKKAKPSKKIKEVIVIDEYADLSSYKYQEMGTIIDKKGMRTVKGDVLTAEQFVRGIAQMGRSKGYHLIIATQRPSVDIITGVIKANIPVRIGLRTVQTVDSRVILDQDGCETLTGLGDSLVLDSSGQMTRVQGYMV